jgi:preprotein translocase subunit YajC
MPEFAFVGLILLLGMGAYWTMVLLPKQRDFQKRQQFVSQLNVGDEVITYGGIIGKVLQVEAGVVHVEIADGVVVRIIAAAVLQPFDAAEIAENAQRALQEKQPTT